MTHALLQSRRASWGLAVPIVIGLGVMSAIIVSVVHGGNDERRETVLRAGTVLVGELEHTVSTRTASVGDAVELRLSEPVAFDAHTVVPAGATVRGEITHVAGGGRIAGAPELAMRFTELATDGDTYPIVTAPFRLRGKSDAVESAAEIGGGAVAGGVVGGVIGGGKGAVEGALLGGAAGTGVAVATEGDRIVLPVGQRIRLRLSAPVTVRYRPHGS